MTPPKNISGQGNPPRSREILAAAWQDVLSRAFQSFAYYHWHTLEKLNPSFAHDTTCITVRNAALESSLMSVRDLDDFFQSKKKKSDDLISADFDFPVNKNILSANERETINKKLAHLTYQAATELQQYPNHNPRTWNSAEIVIRAMTLFLEFLDHVESTLFATDLPQKDMIQIARKTIELTLKNINSIAKHEMNFRA